MYFDLIISLYVPCEAHKIEELMYLWMDLSGGNEFPAHATRYRISRRKLWIIIV